MNFRRITKNFLTVILNTIERILFVRVWTRRNPATGKFEAKDVDYARSKYRPIFQSRQQLADFFLFIAIVFVFLTILYFAAWLFFTIF